jgi:hypothetical protein
MSRRRLVLVSLVCLGPLLSGCLVAQRKTTTNMRSYDYPPAVERPAPTGPDPATKEQDPDSQVWPLGLWLVEFEKRNGVDLHFRDQDTFGRSVVRPGPGPFDSDDEAIAALRTVANKNGLYAIEVRPYVYNLRRALYVR